LVDFGGMGGNIVRAGGAGTVVGAGGTVVAPAGAGTEPQQLPPLQQAPQCGQVQVTLHLRTGSHLVHGHFISL
jgi:hypothetical protein